MVRTSPEPNYPSTVYEIVGITRDTRYSDVRLPAPPMMYAPDSQYPGIGPWAAMMIHSSIEPAAAMAAVSQQFARAHPEIVMESTTFEARIRDRMVRERLLATLAGFFGVLAALLAMVGLYGMIAFAVAQRRQEIGIRVALGADRHTVVALMMREAWRLVAVDGTTFDLPDTAANAAFFGRPGSPRGEGAGAFPQVRVTALGECGTHAIFAAALGPLAVHETELARRLFTRLQAGMLLIADRGFAGFDLWRAAMASGADLLWRVKNSAVLPVAEQLADGSYLSHIYAARDKLNDTLAGLKRMVQAARRGDLPPESELEEPEVPSYIELPATTVTKENVASVQHLGY